jgi:osmotically-inducible protein OsmY
MNASTGDSGITLRNSKKIQGGRDMIKKVLFGALALLVLAGYTGTVPAADKTAATPSQTAPDNTGRNVRDRGGDTMTPIDQSNAKADLNLTQEIRKAIMADDSLSMNAKNVKIITAHGVVTLRGPVNTPQEKATIEAKAQSIAGANNVDSQLEIVRR